MTEATWSGGEPSVINWKMSAALENVSVGGNLIPEVTNLEGAVRAWKGLEPELQEQAVLTLEHPIVVTGSMPVDSFMGAAIGQLAERLPD